MKKFIISLLLLAVIAFAIYWLWYRPKDTTEDKEPVPLAITDKSDVFRSAFGDLMSAYYSLKDGFVNWDTSAVNKAALSVQAKADSLPYSELKGDSNIVETAKTFSMSVSAESKGILGETSIEQKRRSFYTLSENLYNLVRTVRYGGEVIYHQRCPMAFNDDEEAFWLSNSREIMNPYLGKSHPKYKAGMLHCGDVSDSLDFRKQ
ncbi:MAG TPA: DUF3347 domain-containing protein [Chitinophagaceae bacterium]